MQLSSFVTKQFAAGLLCYHLVIDWALNDASAGQLCFDSIQLKQHCALDNVQRNNQPHFPFYDEGSSPPIPQRDQIESAPVCQLSRKKTVSLSSSLRRTVAFRFPDQREQQDSH
jgi:hypothetical protein